MYGEAAYDVNAGSRGGEDRFNPTRGEQALWTAVLTQAIQDIKSKNKKSEERAAQFLAEQWIGSEDFFDVCERAGMNPRHVLSKIEKARERGFEWRLPAGQGWRSKARDALVPVDGVAIEEPGLGLLGQDDVEVAADMA